MSIVSYKAEGLRSSNGENVYMVDGFRYADQGMNHALEDGLKVPTIPELVGIEGVGKNVMSSSLRISMKREGKPDVTVYVHIPLQGSLDASFLRDYALFQTPDITAENFGKLLSMDGASDDDGNMLVYVVDNRSELALFEKRKGNIGRGDSGRTGGHAVSANSIEDLWGFRSVSTFFGGHDKLEEYAGRYGISGINLSYLFDKANMLDGSGKQKSIEKLALVGGSPASFSNISTGLELYCLDKDKLQSLSWADFLGVDPLGAMRFPDLSL